MSDNIGERGINERLTGRFDDSFIQARARIDALNSRIFGSVADAWRERLGQGVRAKKTLTRSAYVLLGFVEYALLFVFYAFVFFMTAGGWDQGYSGSQDEPNNE